MSLELDERELLIHADGHGDTGDSLIPGVHPAPVMVMEPGFVRGGARSSQNDDAPLADKESAIEQGIRIAHRLRKKSVGGFHLQPGATHCAPFVDCCYPPAFVVRGRAFGLGFSIGREAWPRGWRIRVVLGDRGRRCNGRGGFAGSAGEQGNYDSGAYDSAKNEQWSLQWRHGLPPSYLCSYRRLPALWRRVAGLSNARELGGRP